MKKLLSAFMVALVTISTTGTFAKAQEAASTPTTTPVEIQAPTEPATSTPESTSPALEPVETGSQDTAPMATQAMTVSYVPTVNGTVLAAGPAGSWNPANWTTTSWSYNFAMNHPNDFIRPGVVTHVTLYLGYFQDDPNREIEFELNGAGDCRTDFKTITEWGIYNGARGAHWNLVTIGPFMGDCYVSGEHMVFLSTSNSNGAGRELGTVAMRAPEGDARSIHIPFILYSQEPELSCDDGSCTSNILFLPGFLGSRLYTKENGHERKLWEPNGSEDLRALKMNADGTSQREVYTRDIIDETNVSGIPFYHPKIYGEFLDYLDELKNEEKIADWHGYAYDWRYDVFDIVDNGALKEDGSREYLETLVDELSETSKTGKVTIVGHSNGGLLAKALMLRLAEDGKEDLIDRVILVASPQIGTPKGLPALLHGRESKSPLGIVMPAATLREVSVTFPGAYGLLPSDAYFAMNPAPIATFGTGSLLTPFTNLFGVSLNSSLELANFVANTPASRTAPPATLIGTPAIGSASLFAKERATHTLLDAWTPPAGTEVHEIAGWGNPTITSIAYYEKQIPAQCFACASLKVLDYKPVLSNDGDDTVVSDSALFMQDGVYFNLNKLFTDFRDNRKHENIVGSVQLQQYISHLIGLNDSYVEILFAEARPLGTEATITASVHSPVIFSIKDTSGKETGIFVPPAGTTDFLYTKDEIPRSGVFYGGEGKYIVLPKTGTYAVNIKGTGTGTFDFVVEDDKGKVLQQFTSLPVSTTTIATLSVKNGSTTDMKLDIDGDGTVDSVVKDKMTRKDAIAYCKKEIGVVRTLLVRVYLLAVMLSIETAPNETKFSTFRTELKEYIRAQIGKNIPANQATGIALCVSALENSKK